MIENVLYFQEMIQNIQYELWEIDHLNPTEFVSRLQMCPPGGWEERVLHLLRQAVHEYQNERAILKYLYIADKLVKVPTFQNAISCFLVEIFTDVFHFLFLQKCNKDLQELKILRKFWVGVIHPYFLTQMKQNVMARTGVDIDYFSKAETISKIKSHFSNKLGMSPDQIQKHFPSKPAEEKKIQRRSQDRKIERRSQEGRRNRISEQRRNDRRSEERINHQYIYESQKKYQLEGIGYQIQPKLVPNYNSNNYENGYNMQYRYQGQYNYNQHSNYQPYSADQSKTLDIYSQGQNYHKYPQTTGVSPPNDPRLQNKRKRLASEETRAVVIQQPESKPKKQQHVQETTNTRSFFEKINELIPFECRECGIRFSSEDNLDVHKLDHVAEMINYVEGNNKARTWQLCSDRDWAGLDAKQVESESFMIKEDCWAEEQAWCSLCCCWMTKTWVKDQWVFSNACLVNFSGQMSLMHKSCQRILEKSHLTNQF